MKLTRNAGLNFERFKSSVNSTQETFLFDALPTFLVLAGHL